MFQSLLRFGLWNSDKVISAAACWEAIDDEPNPDTSIGKMNSTFCQGKLQRTCGHIYCAIIVSFPEMKGLCPDRCVSLNTCLPSGDSCSTQCFCKLFLLALFSKSYFYLYMGNLSSHVSLALLLMLLFCMSALLMRVCLFPFLEYYGLNCVLPKRYVEVLTLSTLEDDPILKEGLYRSN